MAPALCGPTSSTPKRSTLAMVPPPALTVLMSIIGTARSRPSILPRLVKIGAPSLISATSHEVPPMSKVMMLGSPVMRLAATPAATPPAGPDRTGVTAGRAASGNGDVMRQDWLQVGVDHRRRQPVVLADLRQDFRRQRDIAARQFLMRDVPHP